MPASLAQICNQCQQNFQAKVPRYFLQIVGEIQPGYSTSKYIGGLTVDIFSGTLGLHAASAVFAGFIRPFVIKLVGEKPEYDITTQPKLQQMGLKWFIAYALLMIFGHHLFLNSIDVFSFAEFGQTMLRVLISTLFTFVFIILFEYIAAPRKERIQCLLNALLQNNMDYCLFYMNICILIL